MPIVRMCLFRSSSARSNQTILNSLICCGASVVVSFAGPVRRYLSEDPRTQTSGSHAFSTDRYREHVGLETDDWTERAAGFGMLESASFPRTSNGSRFCIHLEYSDWIASEVPCHIRQGGNEPIKKRSGEIDSPFSSMLAYLN